jgi:hypothetical protein
MTLFDVDELTAYWAEHPPLHILVGAFLGIGNERRKPAPRRHSGPDREADTTVASLLAEVGPGFGAQDVHAGLPPVTLDVAELRRKTSAFD